MSKISCAVLRSLLSVGTEFVGEYIGPHNPGLSSRRRVEKQTAHSMASKILEGPKAERVVYCDWRGVTVREEDGGYILTDNNAGSEDFLRITSIVRAAVVVLFLLCVSGCATTRQSIVATWEPMPDARVCYMVEIGGSER